MLRSELIKHFKHASNKQPATVEKPGNILKLDESEIMLQLRATPPPSSGSRRKARTWERSLAFHFLVVDVEWAKVSLQHSPGKYVLRAVWGDQSLLAANGLFILFVLDVRSVIISWNLQATSRSWCLREREDYVFTKNGMLQMIMIMRCKCIELNRKGMHYVI